MKVKLSDVLENKVRQTTYICIHYSYNDTSKELDCKKELPKRFTNFSSKNLNINPPSQKLASHISQLKLTISQREGKVVPNRQQK